MKGRILFLFFIFITFKANPESYIEAGLIPSFREWDNYDNQNMDINNLIYIEFFSDWSLRLFHIGGDITIYMLKNYENLSFTPIYTDYTFFTYFELEMFDFGYRHSCFHPQNTHEGLNDRSPIIIKQKTIDQFYVRLKLGGD